jgi:hypothetical protein
MCTHGGEGVREGVRVRVTFLKRCLRRRARVHDGSAALRSEPRVLRRDRRIPRRQLRVRRHELFIPRRQCAGRSGVPASCTPRLVLWGVERCPTFVCAACGADRVAIGARCAQLRHFCLEVGQAQARLLLGEQRSWRLGSCTSACRGAQVGINWPKRECLREVGIGLSGSREVGVGRRNGSTRGSRPDCDSA